ncbi:MAG: CDP-diacylglycerol--glycerol-3-phosphate 3-phosphatidyltransferase [Gammaproteobacteria bacterium SG8_31]|nr:MAG: CDP-diacylglycerol--glycerol-3-phosphate 3-phosphatidyltransferase [Gammaproteobacteria bacterium SG8_31]
MNLPTVLTLIRIALIPLFVVVFFLPFWWARPAAAIIFSLAGITDWLDGYYARKLGLTSSFGAFLDPVADKLMVAVALVLIVQTDHRLIISLSAAVIIGREIAISALREWMAELGRRHHVAVTGVAKLKTIFQITALIMMIFKLDLWILPMYPLGSVLLVLAAALTLWSMFIYLKAAWESLEDMEREAARNGPGALDRSE